MSLKAVFLDYASLDRGDLHLNELQQHFKEFHIYPSTQPEDVLLRLAGVEVAIVNKVVLSAATIQQLPQLQLILIAATGSNNVDLEAARARNIPVLNCQGYGTHSVAQHTFALILALATNLMAYHQAVKQGFWQRSEQFCLLDYPIIELAGKTIGIIGYGELGQAVAQLAKAFGMQVLIGKIPDRPARADAQSLEQLLPQVDVLSLHCPLTPQTKNLIDAQALAKMKASSLLINTARGGIVDEQALYLALKNQQIAGAALDVLSSEPPTQDNILLAQTLPNLIITPHSAWGSVQARQNILNQLADNVRSFQQGRLIRQVN
jgi:glycerate dehydrogenase